MNGGGFQVLFQRDFGHEFSIASIALELSMRP
jgi:hypothetical protein